jgi:hypothetical protein
MNTTTVRYGKVRAFVRLLNELCETEMEGPEIRRRMADAFPDLTRAEFDAAYRLDQHLDILYRLFPRDRT